MTPSAPLVAHLVGSVPLADPTAVFEKVGTDLGRHVRTLPDGETGRRADWIGFVRRSLGRNPAFEKDPDVPLFQFKQWDGKVVMEWPLLRFADTARHGTPRDRVSFETGYAENAIASYRAFAAARAAGTIPAGVKFQICAATPLAIAYMYVSPRDQADFTAAYSAHLAGEIAKIAQALPNDDLAFQWDVCQEVLMWEGFFDQPTDYKNAILGSLARIGDAVPRGIDLGYHLCYGSPADEHCVIPKDLGVAVEIANGIFARLERGVRYLHLPVPHDRTDAGYVRPLRDLTLPAGASFYLGCVHAHDERGNARRLEQAQRVTAVAGIGSECGWGRADPAKLDAIIAAHKALLGPTAAH
jgi:hypothetical protein